MYSERICTPAMSARNGQVVGRDTLERTTCISGNPEEHVDFARQYLDLGFTHLFFHSAEPDQANFLQKYGRDVLPHLRALGGRQPVRKAA